MAALSGRTKSAELVLLTALGAVLFFGGWQIVAASGLVSKQVLPSPFAVLDAGWTMMHKPFAGNLLRVHHAVREIAVHERRLGRFERVVDPAHFAGVVGFRSKATSGIAVAPDGIAAADPALLRPLLEYERLVGGGWSGGAP